MRKLGSTILVGAAVAASLGRAAWARFPGPGENSALDLVAFHGPGLHARTLKTEILWFKLTVRANVCYFSIAP